MRLNYVKTAVALVFAVVLGASVYAQATGQAQQGQAGQPPAGRGRGGPPQNLQVLPKDWTTQQVQQFMRTFTAALGVECSHCHVGTPQERAKDDNPKKAIARKMLQMTMAINNDMLKGIGEPAPEGTRKVTCFTCHHGALKPLTAPAAAGGGN